MKRKNIVILIVLLLLVIAGCGKKNADVKPSLSQVRNISDLATVKAYYHNVAKVEKKKGQGLTHLFEVDRKYWIEYTGVVKIGIKMSSITIDEKDNVVTINMPRAEILSHHCENYNDDSIYKNEDGFNENKIEDSEVNEAIKKADEEMLEKVKSNQSLFNRAEDGAEKLIQNYIEQVGKISGKKYEVKFVYGE